jgi:hypothetical protein
VLEAGISEPDSGQVHQAEVHLFLRVVQRPLLLGKLAFEELDLPSDVVFQLFNCVCVFIKLRLQLLRYHLLRLVCHYLLRSRAHFLREFGEELMVRFWL